MAGAAQEEAFQAKIPALRYAETTIGSGLRYETTEIRMMEKDANLIVLDLLTAGLVLVAVAFLKILE